MANGVEKQEYTPGYITNTDAHGRKTRHPISVTLRSEDIPAGLDYTQVAAITTLANLFIVLVRTLRAKGIVDEEFLENGEYGLNLIVDVIENMGGSYTEPDIAP